MYSDYETFDESDYEKYANHISNNSEKVQEAEAVIKCLIS